MDTIGIDHGDLKDEALCLLAADGALWAEEELVSRYGRIVRMCARPLFLAGGDSEDLIQEGMLGLLAAIRRFDGGRDASFRTYAEICIRNRLRSAVKAARRVKHTPLNESVSFETPLFDGSSIHLFPSEESPEDLLISREEFKERLDSLRTRLSGFETEVLPHYLEGLTCGEIVQRVGRTPKSVDNAVQRIRQKLARQISSGASSES